MSQTTLIERYQTVIAHIKQLSHQYRQDETAVQLIAVSKTFPVLSSLSTPIPITISKSFISLPPEQPDKTNNTKKHEITFIIDISIFFFIAISLLLES